MTSYNKVSGAGHCNQVMEENTQSASITNQGTIPTTFTLSLYSSQVNTVVIQQQIVFVVHLLIAVTVLLHTVFPFVVASQNKQRDQNNLL